MNWKRAFVRALKVAIPCLGVTGLVLSLPAWPDQWRTFLSIVGVVDSEVARWVAMAVSLAAIASPVVYERLIAWNRRRQDRRFRNLGYLAACETANAYIRFSAKGGGPFVAHTIIRKFEELCPEGVVGKAVYDGYLLNVWLRFNAAELLIKHRNELMGISEPNEKTK